MVITTLDVPNDVTVQQLADRLEEAKWDSQRAFPDDWNPYTDVQTVMTALLMLGTGGDTDPEEVPVLNDMGYGEALRHLAKGGEIRLHAKNLV